MPAHLFGHQRSKSTSVIHTDQRRKISGPSCGVRKVSGIHRKHIQPSPGSSPLPTILVTASPDLLPKTTTPQSPFHLRVNHRHHGSKQLRDCDNSHRPLRHVGSRRMGNLCNPKSRQYLCEETKRAGRGGGRVIPSDVENLEPSESVYHADDWNSDDDIPLRQRAQKLKLRLAGDSPNRWRSKDGGHTFVIFRPPIPQPLSAEESVGRAPTHILPPTPPSSPPLLPRTMKHHRSKSHVIGTMALGGQRPPTPPDGNYEKVEGKRTVSGKVRWEDERDSWF